MSTKPVATHTPPPPGQSWCHGTGTQVNAINIAGQIVGSYHWFGTGPSGFLANGGDIAVIRPANANASCGFIGGMQARGVNASGNVVGFYEDELANAHGFYYADGTFVDIDVPGAIATRAFGIDDAGHVVGHYYDASNVAHGFIATPIPLPAVGWLLAPAFGVIAPWITRRRSVAYRKLT